MPARCGAGMAGARTLCFVIELAVGIGLPLAVQLWDRGRLSPEQRARSWNGATWGAALYAFGPLSMLGWGWVTRKSALGLGLGILTGVGLLALSVGIGRLAAHLLGLPP
jgi:hypothetical protein